MPNYSIKLRNALFNLVLNEAFLLLKKQSIYVFLFLFSYGQLFAQNRNYLGNSLSFSLNSQSVSKLKFKDSTSDSKYNYGYSRFLVGYKHGVYSHFSNEDNQIKFSQISVLPSLQLAKANFGHEQLNRTLVNLKLGIVGIFKTSNKNTFLFLAQAFANEDEYTLSDAVLRYSGMGMFVRKVSPKFSYRAGITFTYLFGEPLALPILGFKYQTGKKSMLNVTLPFVVNWKKQTNIPKLFYGFSLKPSGGINRYQNKLSVDTTNVTLMLRQRSFQFLGDLRIVNKTNIILFQAGVTTNQKVMFTNENNNNIVNNFSFNGSNSIYANITFVWLLSKKTKGKKEVNETQISDVVGDDELSDEAW